MPKGQYERKSKPDIMPGPTPSVQEIINDRLGIPQVPQGRKTMIEEMTKMTFRPHSEPRAAHEYIWEKDGQMFSIVVKDETVHPKEIVSQESYGGANVTFITKYREGRIIATNDPRLTSKIEPDPGAKVFCRSTSGECFTLTPGEFLDLVNDNRARAVSLVTRNY